MDIKNIMVIGSGLMGSGIAQVSAQAGYNVIMNDVKMEFIDKGFNSISKILDGRVKKEKITAADKDAILSRISKAPSFEDAKKADLIIEAAFENFEVKKSIFQKLDSLCHKDVIFATNTSSIPITSLATTVQRPEKFIGMHFFSPVPVMRLVEVIRGKDTSENVVAAVLDFCRKIGKTPILAGDVPGFIVNRFLCLLYNEAANEIYHGLASAEDIDTGLKLGANHPMGPVEIMDMAGVDVVYLALSSLYEMTGEERYKPSPIFGQMITENRLGRKTGRGFYDYGK